ncbi:Multidrug resistance-associated protein 7 [Mizuhopecten yessoensis]|uniref:ABC-type xenobiotic transporter n=1 Tax=Mizuhopecten yessoensis TaxID=6573 RepID=A0A210PP45_MIZYE|nr:Multidrug resistance-associated protein 7 [Mizuhopecten yessoensis]
MKGMLIQVAGSADMENSPCRNQYSDENINISVIREDNITKLQAVDYSVFHDFFAVYFKDINHNVVLAFLIIFSLFLIYRLKHKSSQGKQPVSSNEKKCHKVKKDSSPVPDVRVNEDGVSLFSLLTCNWVRPLLDKGRSGASLSSKDMFPLPSSLNVKRVHERFLEILRGSTTLPDGRTKVTLWKALNHAYGAEFYIGFGLLELVLRLAAFTSTISIWMLISFLENNIEPPHMGYRYVCALFVSTFGTALFDSIYESINTHVYLKVRTSIMTTIYQKILKMSTVSLSQFSTGEFVNFLGTDTDRMVDFCNCFHKMWVLPIEAIICMYALYHLVGVAFLGGLVVALILVPVNKMASTKQIALSKILMEQKDKRTKLMNEVFGGIKIIKFYTWEEHFRTRIDKLREAELQTMKQKNILGALLGYLWTLTPILMTLLTFSAYSMLGNIPTASKMFTSLAIFLKLIGSLNHLPRMFNGMIEAITSLERIEKFVASEDIDLDTYYARILESNQSNNGISVNAGKFTWEREKTNCNAPIKSEIRHSKSGPKTSQSGTLTLRNISIDIKQGQFIGVVGKVGAGKSSFLHALLAEMVREEGNISVRNLEQGFALVNQEPWIQQTTIRDNVLFGSPFHDKKYAETLSAVSLRKDIQDTSLLYQNYTIGVLLRFRCYQLETRQKWRYIEWRSKGKTGSCESIVSVMTCEIFCLQDKDIYLLDDPLAAVDAHVAQHIYDKCIMGLLRNKTRILCTHHTKFLGKADKIIVMNDGVISKMGVPSEILDDTTFAEHNVSPNKPETEYDDTDDNDHGGSLGEEVRATGEVSSRVYMAFLAALGKWLPMAMLLSVALMEGISHFFDISLYDSNDASGSVTTSETSVLYYMLVYGCLAALYSLFSLVKEVLFVYGGINMARIIHNNLLNSMLKAPMSFYDVTPIGRILNRFSSDMGVVDDSLSHMINVILCQLFGVIGTIIIACYGMPWFLLLLFPVTAVYYQIQESYRHTSRKVWRIASLKRSPIFSQFSETVSEVVTIRAFRDTERFKETHIDCVDKWLEATYTARTIGNWLWIKTQMVVYAMMTGIAVLALLEHSIHGIDPSKSAKMYFLKICLRLIYLYISGKANNIAYNVYMKYRDGLPTVLNGLSFSTRHAEKVGIAGRTGSGKSSIFQTLFRTVEIGSGDITIEGMNTQQLDLKDVRRHLAVIPQDPFLFSGTVRENLDPTSRYSDDELWRVLDKCRLHQPVDRLGGLGGGVGEKGRRFSIGQRQLVCLARALLTKAKPSPSWPASGVVIYSNVYMKYRDGLPTVLNGLSFSTRHAEKVGIVGRTGSGKSSIFQTLFRTVEIGSGDITIDGMNTRQLNLKDVRRHLAVIPQDPFLFSGTVRENLDPTSRYSDDELWRVLDKCRLHQPVDRLGGLGGGLRCLARALLSKAKVLCIDEATASVDLETDMLIQATIRQEFVDSTVLTIAHRINTIMDSDRVLVMDKGQVVELDTPENLLKISQSSFYQLVHGETCNYSG